MDLIEIVLLVIGAVVVIASFLIPEKKKDPEWENAVTKEQIKEMFDDEYTDIKVRISQLTDETVEYSVEKAERSLERIANEKMLAFGEYSDSTMTQIAANHQETIFMYDMLNNSKQDLTNLLLQTDKNAQDALVSAQDALKACEGAKIYAKEAMELAETAKTQATEAKEQAIVAEKSMLLARKNAQGETQPNVRVVKKTVKPVSSQATVKANTLTAENNRSDVRTDSEVVKSPVNQTDPATTERRRPQTAVKKTTPKINPQRSFADELFRDETEVSLNFASGEEKRTNSNERILELHRRGKSNMAIAKELGLGIGEVKLVIDLFENK